jgi:hypothetical protein
MATVKIAEMLAFYGPHAVKTEDRAPDNPPVNQWGYALGADGRTATAAYIEALARSLFPGSWQSYCARCARWIGKPVFDCNSLAEYFYRRKTGTSIDTRARYNYSGWCGRKSPSKADKTLAGLPQMPGVAMFLNSSGSSAAGITHVGYLHEKFGPGPLDWYVLEARGADYGLVLTKLAGRGWTWWGVMDKYFEYDVSGSSSSPIAPISFVVPFYAECGGSQVNIRAGRGTDQTILGVLGRGDKILALPAVSGWCEIAAETGGKLVHGYMSAQYVREVGA